MPPFLSRRGFLYLAHRPLLLPRVCHLPQRLRICKKELNEFLYFSRSLSHCLCGWCSRWPFLPRAVSACVSLWPWASATSAPCPALQLIRVLPAVLPEPEHPVFLTYICAFPLVSLGPAGAAALLPAPRLCSLTEPSLTWTLQVRITATGELLSKPGNSRSCF